MKSRLEISLLFSVEYTYTTAGKRENKNSQGHYVLKPGFIEVTERSVIHPVVIFITPRTLGRRIIMDLTTIATQLSINEQKLTQKLYAEFYAYALKIAFRYLHAHDSATAVTNAAFGDIFKNADYLESCRDEHRFKNLITKTTVMKVLKVYDWGAKGEVLNVEADQMIWQTLSPVDPDARLVSFLALLPPLHRALFNMHVIDGFAISEIAKLLRIAESSCASQLQEARTLLRGLVTNDPQLG